MQATVDIIVYKILLAVRSIFLSALLIIGFAASIAIAGGQASMVLLERKLERQFPDVLNMIPEQFEALRAERPNGVIVLDVREPQEFTVSHLPGAVRVDPNISTADFINTFASKLKGKTVILYCSVGYRSSKLASQIQQSLAKVGVKGVYNLRGGIFSWHNAGRSVVQGDAETKYVHPYSKRWSQYLEFDNYARYGVSEEKFSWWPW